MAELAPGETLRVLATDPEAPVDLAAWAIDEGHRFRDLSAGPPAAATDDPERALAPGWLTLELRKG